jgi:hypothetical protein
MAVKVPPRRAAGHGASPLVSLEHLVTRLRHGDPATDRLVEHPLEPHARDHREEEPRDTGWRPEVDLGPHLLLELAERHRLIEGRSAQDRLGGQQRDPPLAERSGHGLGGAGEPYETPGRAGGEIQALQDVVLEALEAELAMETALQDLAQDAADLEVDALEERSGRAEAAVELEGRGGGELALHPIGVACSGVPCLGGVGPAQPRPAHGAQAVLGALRPMHGRRPRGEPLPTGVLLELGAVG